MYNELYRYISHYRKRTNKKHPIAFLPRKNLQLKCTESIINCGTTLEESEEISSSIRADPEFNELLDKYKAGCGLILKENHDGKSVWRLWVRW